VKSGLFNLAFFGLPSLALTYDANDLEQARHCFDKAQQWSHQLGGETHAASFYNLAAPMLDALGQTEIALAALQKASQTAAEGGPLRCRISTRM